MAEPPEPVSTQEGTLPAWIRLRTTGVEVAVRLNPKASREGVQGTYGDRVKIGVNAPPVAGAANDALARFIARASRCAAGQVEVVAGAKSRSKTVLVRCDQPAAVAARLAAELDPPRR